MFNFLSFFFKICIQFLDLYLFLWISDPFLAISDCLNLHAHTLNLSTINSNRNLCLFDLELGMATSVQSSCILAVCMSCLLATPKERSQIVSILGTEDKLTSSNSSNACNNSLDHSVAFKRRFHTKLWSDLVQAIPMDYESWESRLSTRVQSWYRVFWDKGKSDVEWASLF